MDPGPPDPLRVLYVNPFSDLGGAEHSLLALLGTLPAAVSPTLVTSGDGELTLRARELGVPVAHLRFGRVGSLQATRRSLAALTGMLREGRVDLVHGNSSRGAFYAGVAGKRAGTPSIWHMRAHLGGGLKPLVLRRLTTHRIAVSRSLLGPAPMNSRSSRVRVIPDGVPESMLRDTPPPLRERDPRGPIIGMIGWIEPFEGQREFLEMALRFKGAGMPGRFLLAGGTPGLNASRPPRRVRRYVPILKGLLRKPGLAERVRFLGPIDAVREFLDSLDILVVPSHVEGFGRAVIEGMARGLPVVASRVRGIPEIIRTGEDGWLVPPRDPTALFRACRFLVRNPITAHEIGVRAWRRSFSEFRSIHTTRAILDFYSDITGRALGEPSPQIESEVPSCVSLST